MDCKIGLETHIELNTKSKIFCSCAVAFGGSPNSRVCPVCTGAPGALPTLNEEVVKSAVKLGIALSSEVCKVSVFDRKNYFYPDLPKGYQITQKFNPLCLGGQMVLQSGKVIRIREIHIEEDAGKLIHEGGYTLADYNRSGVPLAEIVTEPDFSSGEEVSEYLERLNLLAKTLKISDCKIQEGSMRSDINVSVNGGERTEIKNVSSFSFARKSVEAEVERQTDILSDGGRIISETRRFNEKTGKTEGMRKKETEIDYRYFPDPDLPPLVLTDDFIENIRKTLPALPEEKVKKLIDDFYLKEQDANYLVKYPALEEHFKKILSAVSDREKFSALLLSVLLSSYKTDAERENFGEVPSAEELSDTLRFAETKKLSPSKVRTVLERMVKEEKNFSDIFTESDFEGLSDLQISEIAKQVIGQNSAAVKDFLGGKTKALASLVGGVMKLSGGRANPKSAERIVREMLGKMSDGNG